MSKGADKVAAIALGITGGLLLLEILRQLSKKKCRYCQNEIQQNEQVCKFCGGHQ